MITLTNLSLTRRDFVTKSLASGSALLLGFSLPGCGREEDGSSTTQQSAPAAVIKETLTPFIQIDGDGVVTVFSPFVEMGQGIYTSIPMLVAEELDIDMEGVRVEQAPHGPDYRIMFNNTARFTGGSYSIRSAFEPLRTAGAAARAMLLQAAAQQWQVDGAELTTRKGQVIHAQNHRQAGYGELVSAAAKLDVPVDIALKKPANFSLIGTSAERTDVAAKVNGSAVFGIDYQFPGMLTAAVKQSPVYGGRVSSMNAAPVLALPGVRSVDEIPNGVAVIADSYWRAQTALNKLEVSFSGGIDKQFSSSGYLETLQSRLNENGIVVKSQGDVEQAMSQAHVSLEADYSTPFLAHTTLEPMNCTALVTRTECTVWAPNQGVDRVAEIAEEITGLGLDNIVVHTPYLGGGFGRRSMGDFVEQAATLANRHKGTPVKVTWSREEDLQHDFYRPMTAARFRAALDDKGNITAFHARIAGDGPTRRHNSRYIGKDDIDRSVIEGAVPHPYHFVNQKLEYLYEYSPAPVGYWRSVGNSHNAFFKESFLDELARASQQDPVALRRRLLEGNSRYQRVLDETTEMANWRTGIYPDANRNDCAMGVAMNVAYGTAVCQIAEVTLDEAGRPRVNSVWCGVDCGIVVNPRIITMQMESGIAFGLSAALHEEVKITNGRAANSNFHDYPILTVREMPAVQVKIINSEEPPGGIGETGTPPIAPAVCNALFTLTGKRIRSLPIKLA